MANTNLIGSTDIYLLYLAMNVFFPNTIFSRNQIYIIIFFAFIYFDGQNEHQDTGCVSQFTYYNITMNLKNKLNNHNLCKSTQIIDNSSFTSCYYLYNEILFHTILCR